MPDEKESSLTVLVVDDYEETRALLALQLRHGGHRVVEAANGAEALDAARLSRPDVVLMDLSMPRMDGLSATCRLRELPGMSDVPVVVITAHSPEMHRDAALAAGCDAFLTKPVAPDELLRVVEGLAAGGRRAGEDGRRPHIESRDLSDEQLLDAIEQLFPHKN
jgi:CheY-like chemotaxis protein